VLRSEQDLESVRKGKESCRKPGKEAAEEEKKSESGTRPVGKGGKLLTDLPSVKGGRKKKENTKKYPDSVRSGPRLGENQGTPAANHKKKSEKRSLPLPYRVTRRKKRDFWETFLP